MDTGAEVPVPCGRCPNCRKRRVSGWSFRLLQEEKKCESAHFVTFTYDAKNVPNTDNGLLSLDKGDMQNFFKRLRKKSDYHTHKDYSVPIKYFVCGEYGSDTQRPHYHAIIFNSFEKDIVDAWMIDGKPIGFTYFGGVSGGSVGYTLKYMCKQGKVGKHHYDDRVPEFQLMSKGLGVGYINKNTIKWHLSDINNRCYVPIEDGKKICMPRYYKDKIYNDEQRESLMVSMLEQNEDVKHVAVKEAEDIIQRIGINRYQRLMRDRVFSEYEKQKINNKRSKV